MTNKKIYFFDAGHNTIKTNNSAYHTTFTITDNSIIARLYSDRYLNIKGYSVENSSWSDEKLKKNIKKADSNNLLDLVNKLDVVNYNLKSDNNENVIGFIADDVADIFPDIVKNTDAPFNLKQEDVIPCKISNNILPVTDCYFNSGDTVLIDDNTEIICEDIINDNTYKVECCRDISNTNIKDIRYDSIKIIQYNK